MAETVEQARAKLNLCLHVTGRRADGYHLLDSLVVFPDIGDRITVAPSDALTLAITGPFAADLSAGADNLVLRAARLAGRTGAITLQKNLPVASGIGGGSADAAALLRAVGPPFPALDDLVALGADVPVCLSQMPARMRGIGDQMSPIRLPKFACILANPGVAVPTASVFSARSAPFSQALPALPALADFDDLLGYLGQCDNDLQPAATGLVPVIGEVLRAIDALPACGMARMSGSGATCFGLFADLPTASAAAATLARAHPEWWVVAARV